MDCTLPGMDDTAAKPAEIPYNKAILLFQKHNHILT
jgi:hypothetical protein